MYAPGLTGERLAGSQTGCPLQAPRPQDPSPQTPDRLSGARPAPLTSAAPSVATAVRLWPGNSADQLLCAKLLQRCAGFVVVCEAVEALV